MTEWYKVSKGKAVFFWSGDFYFECSCLNFRSRACLMLIGWQRLSPPARGSLFGAKADMEELSAVGEQVFDAECILNKRLRKVSELWKHLKSSFSFSRVQCWIKLLFVGFLSGEVGVSGEVEGMVIQVSTSGAAARNNENNNNVSLVAFRETVADFSGHITKTKLIYSPSLFFLSFSSNIPHKICFKILLLLFITLQNWEV